MAQRVESRVSFYLIRTDDSPIHLASIISYGIVLKRIKNMLKRLKLNN